MLHVVRPVCHIAGQLAVASAPRASPVTWFSTGAADANDTEMLFFGFLLVLNAVWAKEVGQLNEWARSVLLEKAAAVNEKASAMSTGVRKSHPRA